MTEYEKYEPFFGTWYIKRKIGEGSFGQVFEIEKRGRMLGEPSALKVISIPQNQEDAVTRMAEGTSAELLSEYYDSVLHELEHEITAMSALKGNSNIVSLEDYDVKSHEDGIGYDLLIKMELLEPLTERMGEMSVRDVMRLGIDICSALEECHQNQIIHRDIKPSNIFIAGGGKYKLGDFGIARTMSNANTVMSRKGTFRYMAPEIFQGSQEYDKTVDIYSLGLVMYFLLNGKRDPFNPANTMQSEQEAFSKRMGGEALPSLSVPEMLDTVIRKACAYEPAERFQSAKEMRRELERVLGSLTATYLDSSIAKEPEDSSISKEPEEFAGSNEKESYTTEKLASASGERPYRPDSEADAASAAAKGAAIGQSTGEKGSDVTEWLGSNRDEDPYRPGGEDDPFRADAQDGPRQANAQDGPKQADAQDGPRQADAQDGPKHAGMHQEPKQDSVHSAAQGAKEPLNKKIIAICVAAAVLLFAVGFFVLHGGSDGEEADSDGGSSSVATESSGDVELHSTVVHANAADGVYEVAVIMQVTNDEDNATLTSLRATEVNSANEFTVYGCIPPGEEGLMAGIWRDADYSKGDTAYEVTTTEYSFDSDAPGTFSQIHADLLDRGTNVTMELAHGSSGFATEWNDDDFAEYQIGINNNNDVSLDRGEAVGVAVVYDGDQLKQGDIFYNQLDAIGAGSAQSSLAVLPKALAEADGLEILILPRYEVN